MRLYILDPNGRPVHVLDGHSHYRFLKDGFRRFVLRTDLPYQGAHVWTCFSPWSDARGDIPVFLTHLKGPSVDKVFTSSSWEEAQEKHRRVAEKAQRVLPAQKS
ncbi:hypothetical protein [Cupriavidus basilensis]|uniref:hypothetical protein n=1 Tax=Cupriavidus basilensis TaxID=68895 RepID=UPI0005B916BA|nr:hypothetical protein [Cupriavidus basilensis]